MSMLAEQRRRTKWVINPTKKPLWTADSNGIKIGKQLMEKMGWSAGKGLGLNEQGIQEPLKVGFKNDTKGVGFKENLDDWIEHQDEFNILLNQLRSNNDSSILNGSNEEKIAVMSLEEKSKQSKARVHYQKFTRGKDLSKYSANDLACILGSNKSKKEKPKPEVLAEAESEVSGNYETSFGVTTINSGSIQDYFKKKLITGNVKCSNFFSPDDNTFEDSREGLYKEENCFSVHDEEGIKLESGEKKSRKRKHKSSSDFDSLHVEETNLSKLDEVENVNGAEKKKKWKKEVVIYSQEEPKSKMKNKSVCMDENIPEKGCLILEESESLSQETENSSTAERQIKEDRNLMTVEMTNFVDKSKKEKKRTKRNVEECTTEDVFHAETVYGTNNRDSKLDRGSVKKKKKKKKKNKEELEENELEEMFENQHDNSNQEESSYNHSNRDMSETEPVNMKRRRAESEKLKEINIKDVSSLQYILSSSYINDSCLNIEKTQELRGPFEADPADVKSQRKKNKKKNIKEKIEQLDDYYISQEEVPSSGVLDMDVDKRKISKSERKSIPEVVSGKKKKKNKNEKVELIKEMEYEDIQSNKNKESHLEKEVSEKIIFHCQGEDALEVEPVKIKKKKNHNKDRSVEFKTKDGESCSKEDNVKVTFEEENVNVEFVKKKKKKKNKNEILEEKQGIENKNEHMKQSKAAEKNSVGMRKEIEKSGIGIIDNKLQHLSKNNNDNSNNYDSNTKAENRIEKLRANLFRDKAADKYFPEQGYNERVLKLIRWANLSEFRGSNLRNVEGYGRQKEYEKQFR